MYKGFGGKLTRCALGVAQVMCGCGPRLALRVVQWSVVALHVALWSVAALRDGLLVFVQFVVSRLHVVFKM